MRVALISSSVVQAVAKVDDVDAMRAAWSHYDAIVSLDDVTPVSPGDAYDGQSFGPPPVTPQRLADVKSQKLAAIQVRTAELRAIGFLHTDGHRYSLEHDALRQVMEAKSWAVYDQEHGTTNMRYPLVWPSVDRGAFWYMPDGAAVIAFALAASLADRALTEAGAGLEMTLAQAETIADVNAVVDSRA